MPSNWSDFTFNTIFVGESIAISSEFQNQSGRRIKPRATLYQRTTFFADGKSRSVRNAVASLQGNTIRGRRTETWSNKLLKIPPITPTLTNCGIIKLEYFLTVSMHQITFTFVFLITFWTYKGFVGTIEIKLSLVEWQVSNLWYYLICTQCRSCLPFDLTPVWNTLFFKFDQVCVFTIRYITNHSKKKKKMVGHPQEHSS